MRSGVDRRGEGRRAVVTGGAGFIGSHLCDWPPAEDQQIMGYQEAPRRLPSMNRLKQSTGREPRPDRGYHP